MRLPEAVYTDALHVLTQAKDALEHKNTALLRSVSNQTIHNASIFQDEFSIRVATVTYALSKLVESSVNKNKNIDVVKYGIFIDHLITHLHERDTEGFENTIQKIFVVMQRDEGEFRQYVIHVRTQANLNKSAKLVDHGLSVAQASSKTGVSQWQIYNYMGKTTINDDGTDSVGNAKKRLNYAMKLFSKRW